MNQEKINAAVDAAFDKALKAIQPRMDRELYPRAFANEYSWLSVKNAINLNNAAIRQAVKDVLAEVLAED